MNSSPSRHDLAIDEQAATWAARLDGDVLEAGERAALDAWLAQSPAPVSYTHLTLPTNREV